MKLAEIIEALENIHADIDSLYDGLDDADAEQRDMATLAGELRTHAARAVRKVAYLA